MTPEQDQDVCQSDFVAFRDGKPFGKNVPYYVYAICRLGFGEGWIRGYKEYWVARHHNIHAVANERMRLAFAAIGQDHGQRAMTPNHTPSSGGQMDEGWFQSMRALIIRSHLKYFPDVHVKSGVPEDKLVEYLDSFYRTAQAMSWRSGWVNGTSRASQAMQEREKEGLAKDVSNAYAQAREIEHDHVQDSFVRLFGRKHAYI